MKNLSISTRLIIMMAPSIAIILLGGLITTSAKFSTYQAMKGLPDVVRNSSQVGNAIHELQKERGATAIFLASGGTQFGTELNAQRGLTDHALIDYKEAASGLDRLASASLQAQLRKDAADVDGLAAHRSRIDRAAIEPGPAGAYYTQMIAGLLQSIDMAALSSADGGIARDMLNFTRLLHAKEFAGQERAAGAGGFAAGHFDAPTIRKMSLLAGEQDALLALIADEGPAVVRDRLRDVDAKEGVEVSHLRQVAVDSVARGNTDAVTGPQWFTAATARIDALHAVETAFAAVLIADSQGIVRSALQAVWLAVGLLAVVAAASVALATLVSRSITVPLTGIGQAMGTLAGGTLSVTIPGDERRDEVGDMARSVLVFRDSMQQAEQMRAAQGIEREQAERSKVAALQSMAERVEGETRAAVEQVAHLTESMSRNAQSMLVSAEAVGSNSQSVAAAATQALANAQTVASAAEQLSASINEISAQIGTSNQMTNRAVDASMRAQDTIRRLSMAVGRIGDVAELINDIAGQTNLLALNATIEAARAGEAGKGFAVVANEVKTLANQTARATGDITAQIADIRATTEGVVQSVAEINGAIGDVQHVSVAVAAAIEEQGAATQEIARNVVQTTAAAQEVAERIAHVSAEALATGDNATVVGRISGEVAEGINRLREVLVRVVRTSTKEVNRRQSARYPIECAATLKVGGQIHPMTVSDVSEGGLAAVGLPVDLSPGTRVEVGLPGIQVPLSMVVLASDHGRLHGRFDLAAAIDQQWRQQLPSLVRGVAPLG